jgi:four helix bundle protein
LQVLRSLVRFDVDDSACLRHANTEILVNETGTVPALPPPVTAGTFRELRAWQTTYAFKLAVYRLIATGPLSQDERLSKQLREAAASAASHVCEGFGRFDPVDFARFVKMGRASLMECRNHLQDAVDRGHITDDLRQEHEAKAQEALKEMGGLLDYLQSPEAKHNAERIRQKRFERRNRRLNSEPRTRNPNPEPRTGNPNPEHELGTRNREPGTD